MPGNHNAELKNMLAFRDWLDSEIERRLPQEGEEWAYAGDGTMPKYSHARSFIRARGRGYRDVTVDIHTTDYCVWSVADFLDSFRLVASPVKP